MRSIDVLTYIILFYSCYSAAVTAASFIVSGDFSLYNQLRRFKLIEQRQSHFCTLSSSSLLTDRTTNDADDDEANENIYFDFS